MPFLERNLTAVTGATLESRRPVDQREPARVTAQSFSYCVCTYYLCTQQDRWTVLCRRYFCASHQPFILKTRSCSFANSERCFSSRFASSSRSSVVQYNTNVLYISLRLQVSPHAMWYLIPTRWMTRSIATVLTNS